MKCVKKGGFPAINEQVVRISYVRNYGTIDKTRQTVFELKNTN